MRASGFVSPSANLSVGGSKASSSTGPPKEAARYSVPTFAGTREKPLLSDREAELQRAVESDSAQVPVIHAKKSSAESTLQEREDHLATGHAEYRG